MSQPSIQQVQALARRIDELEKRLANQHAADTTTPRRQTIGAADEVVITCGKASLILKKDGTVTIRAKDFDIAASGHATIKAARDLTLKGSRVL